MFANAQKSGKISSEVIVRLAAHDEIVFEALVEIAEETQKQVVRLMTGWSHFVCMCDTVCFKINE